MAVNDEIFKNLAQYGGGTINERVYNFLGSLGYTGTINDRLSKFEEGGRKGWQGLIRAWGQWAPAQLFSQGQGGVWYEPKPIVAGQQVLYQDSAGTTPVTADGDPVGLMLDRSRGLVKGPELVTNGTFDQDISGWSNPAPSRGSLSWISPGALRVDGSDGDGNTPVARYHINLPANSSYEITWEVPNASVVNGGDQFQTSQNNGNDGIAISDGRYKAIIHPEASETWIQLYGEAMEVVDFDNVSIRELPGNHATQSTSASRPIYRTDGVLHWLEGDGVDDGMRASGFSVTQPHVTLFAAVVNNNEGTVADAYTSGRMRIWRASSQLYTFAGVVRSSDLGFSADPIVGVVKWNTSNTTVRVDGVEDNPSDAGNQNADGLVIMNRNPGGAAMEGKLFGFISTDESIAGGAIETTESYLASLAGVAL